MDVNNTVAKHSTAVRSLHIFLVIFCVQHWFLLLKKKCIRGMLAILLKQSLLSVFSGHISLNKQYVIVLVISLHLCELQEYTNGLYRLTFMDV